MDILAQGFKSPKTSNRWLNSTSDDLASIEKQITDINIALSNERIKNREASSNVSTCTAEKEGFFSSYNCKKNTGKTLNDWEAIQKASKSQTTTLSSQLTNLQKEQTSLLKKLAEEAEASGRQSEADRLRSEASIVENELIGKQAITVGKWVGIGLGTVAIIALIYVKIIKKK